MEKITTNLPKSEFSYSEEIATEQFNKKIDTLYSMYNELIRMSLKSKKLSYYKDKLTSYRKLYDEIDTYGDYKILVPKL